MANFLYDYSFFNTISAFSKTKRKGDISTSCLNPIVFYTIFILTLILWVIGLALLVTNAGSMPMWMIVLCILLLLFVSGGPVIVIVLCLFLKKDYLQYHGLPYSPDMYSPSSEY